jgi:hypothetical protein
VALNWLFPYPILFRPSDTCRSAARGGGNAAVFPLTLAAALLASAVDRLLQLGEKKEKEKEKGGGATPWAPADPRARRRPSGAAAAAATVRNWCCCRRTRHVPTALEGLVPRPRIPMMWRLEAAVSRRSASTRPRVTLEQEPRLKTRAQ